MNTVIKVWNWIKSACGAMWGWIRTDGLLHFAVSAIIMFALGWIRPVGIAVIITLVIGVLKEVYDYFKSKRKGVKHDWDNTWHDLVCDLWGTIVGFMMVWINLLAR